MAKVTLNPILEQLRGQVGDLVFKRYGDGVVISRKRQNTAPPTAAQLEQRARFQDAVVYGRTVMADPESRAIFDEEAKDRGVPVFSVTIADFYNGPSIDEVDLSGYAGAVGDEIVVFAHDDMAVKQVSVALTDTGGAPIEDGPAVEPSPGSGRWVYTATAAVAPGTTVRIVVTAEDAPGGTAEADEQKTV